MTHWLVLPSPFLGSTAYAPFVDELRTGTGDASVATYAEELSRARVLEWPVQVFEGAGHRHLIVRPDQVADLVRSLTRSITPRRPGAQTSSR